MPQLEAPLIGQLVDPVSWISSQVICAVLRAVTTLSSASFASCLAIRLCCEVCVEAIAKPNTPSRLTIPTVNTAIEIATSISENPLSACFGGRRHARRLIIDVTIGSLPHCRSEEHTSELQSPC